jgi:hypothetical protein
MYVIFFGRSKHSEVGIFNDENVKEFNFIKIFEDACIYKKVSGALRHISNTLCRRHIGYWKLYIFLDIVNFSLKLDF